MKKSIQSLFFGLLLVCVMYADEQEMIQDDYAALATQDGYEVSSDQIISGHQVVVTNPVQPQLLYTPEPFWYAEDLKASNNLTKQERLLLVNGVFTIFWAACVKLDDQHGYYTGLQKEQISAQHDSYLYLRRLEKDLARLSQLEINYLFSRVTNDLYTYFITRTIDLPYDQKLKNEPNALSDAERARLLQMVRVMFTKLYPPVFGDEHVAFLQKVDAMLQSLSRKATADSLASFMCWSFDYYCKELGIDMMRPLEV